MAFCVDALVPGTLIGEAADLLNVIRGLDLGSMVSMVDLKVTEELYRSLLLQSGR